MLVLQLQGKSESVNIPFTDVQLAQQWGNYLNQEWLEQKPV
jgi:hypothetical protein